jgi:hypothetical protein
VTFSEAQFTDVVRQIDNGMNNLSAKIAEIPRAAHAAVDHWYIPGFVADAIMWLAQKISDLANWIWNKIKEVLEGVAAPLFFFLRSFDWQDVRGLATQVGGQLKPGVLTTVGNTWKGTAATAYGKIIQPQGAAADKIGAISDKISTALQLSAAAGLVFYLAIGAILVKFIAAMVTVIAALGTVVFSWAGVALVVEEAGVNSALIWAAITALSSVLAWQVQQLIAVHGELSDQSAFPGGHWPDPTTGSYNDGSVKDGDADWSLTG